MDQSSYSYSEFAGDADTSRRTRLFTQDNQPASSSALELHSKAFEDILDRLRSK